jgi:hypothetical protein
VIGARLDVAVGVVANCRKRFAEEGVTGLADRERGGRSDVIPSRHEDVWDYGGAAGTGPGPGQSVLR